MRHLTLAGLTVGPRHPGKTRFPESSVDQEATAAVSAGWAGDCHSRAALVSSRCTQGPWAEWEGGLRGHQHLSVQTPDKRRFSVTAPGSSLARAQLNPVLNINVKKILSPDKCCSAAQGDSHATGPDALSAEWSLQLGGSAFLSPSSIFFKLSSTLAILKNCTEFLNLHSPCVSSPSPRPPGCSDGGS